MESETYTDPIVSWEAKVEEEQQRYPNRPRHEIVKAVARKFPQLREAYVVAFNQQHRARR